MFAKTETPSESAARAAVEPRPGERPSVISADLEVQGDLKSEGDIQIDGQVKGDVRSRTVVVSQGADIEGSIFADSVQISRVNIQSVKLNAPMSDELFAKPASVKAIK